MKKKNQQEFEEIIIPKFIFEDGAEGVFVGFDRGCCPTGEDVPPRYFWEMGIFDAVGNYFKIEIDTRKAKRCKQVTFLLGGKPYFHPITQFFTITDCLVNPENGYLIDLSQFELLDEDDENICLCQKTYEDFPTLHEDEEFESRQKMRLYYLAPKNTNRGRC